MREERGERVRAEGRERSEDQKVLLYNCLFMSVIVVCNLQELGGKLSYKGRIDMNKCFIVDVKDGECKYPCCFEYH